VPSLHLAVAPAGWSVGGAATGAGFAVGGGAVTTGLCVGGGVTTCFLVVGVVFGGVAFLTVVGVGRCVVGALATAFAIVVGVGADGVDFAELLHPARAHAASRSVTSFRRISPQLPAMCGLGS
jgi:hypothetical protein